MHPPPSSTPHPSVSAFCQAGLFEGVWHCTWGTGDISHEGIWDVWGRQGVRALKLAAALVGDQKLRWTSQWLLELALLHPPSPRFWRYQPQLCLQRITIMKDHPSGQDFPCFVWLGIVCNHMNETVAREPFVEAGFCYTKLLLDNMDWNGTPSISSLQKEACYFL